MLVGSGNVGSTPSTPSFVWPLAGALSGLATVGLLYLGALLREDAVSLTVLVDLHRRWPAFLVLDTAPIVLALVGLLVQRNRAAQHELGTLHALLGPWGDGALAQALLDPALVVDADGRVVAANRVAGPLFGRDSVLGAPIRELLPDHDRIEAAGANERAGGMEWRMTAARPNGSTVSVAVSCAPATGRRVVYVVRAAGAEVPSRVSAELETERQRLLKERDEARASDQAKGAFLANLSHELRTPLNAILGYADLLRDEIRDAGIPLLREIESVRGATKHLLALVTNVLDLAKIDAGRLSVVLEPVPLAPLLTDVEGTARPLAAANRNTLEVRVAAGLHAVRGDELRLRQVLLNLVGNACKFTSDGKVTVDVRFEPGERGRGAVSIEVTDSGIGMTPEQVGRLFREFVQADAKVQKKYGGTGLGLAISKRLVERMGGTIAVRSALGEGSTFTVRLPFGASTHHTMLPELRSKSFPSIPAAGPPLVVVDDGDRLKRELAGVPDVVWEAQRDPLVLAARRPRGLVLAVDPGDPLLDALAATPSLEGVPIVALSADDPTSGQGRISWLPLPLDPKALLSTLRQADRVLAGALVIGSGADAERVTCALEARGWRTEAVADTVAAQAVVHRRRVALVVLVRGSRDPLPPALSTAPVARVGDDGVPLVDDDAALVDLIELVSTRAEG